MNICLRIKTEVDNVGMRKVVCITCFCNGTAGEGFFQSSRIGVKSGYTAVCIFGKSFGEAAADESQPDDDNITYVHSGPSLLPHGSLMFVEIKYILTKPVQNFLHPATLPKACGAVMEGYYSVFPKSGAAFRRREARWSN